MTQEEILKSIQNYRKFLNWMYSWFTITVLEVIIWLWRTWSAVCRPSARCVLLSASKIANTICIMRGLSTVRRLLPTTTLILGGIWLWLWRRTWFAVCRPSARCALSSASNSQNSFTKMPVHKGRQDQNNVTNRRYLTMSMKKNLIKGMTEIGMLNAVFGIL